PCPAGRPSPCRSAELPPRRPYRPPCYRTELPGRMGTSQPNTWASRAIARLSRPCDGASLAVFRICFGLLLAYEIDFKFKAKKVDELHASHLSFKYPL